MNAPLLLLLAACLQPSPVTTESLDPEHAQKMKAGLELFKASVRPTLVKHCLSCHGGEATEAELDLTTRDKLLKGGMTGPAIAKGNPDQSLLVTLIRHDDEPKMPMDADKLSAEEIAGLAKWIELGAPYEGSLLEEAAENRDWTKRVIPPEAKQHWAFKPLAMVDPPEVEKENWCQTPVDRFVLSKLEAKGLTPNPPVDKGKLLRRLTLDLIGLPPTPEEIAAFEADQSPDALDKVLHRLFTSTQHGERWARHWLDVVRFGESHGFEHDTDRPSAYHYRDFVIKALAGDMPFDQFVRWQIAGDELAPEEPLALMATGFLGAGVHSTQITKNEVEKHRYDEMDDMLATIGTSMLGLTIGCARCHDHKYDPIPQRDYYQLLSTFTTTIRGEMELDLDPAVYQQAKADYEREHAPLVQALREFETQELPQRFATWEQNRSSDERVADWFIVVPQESKSAGGATITTQPDDSLLVNGNNAQFDTYTLTIRTELAGVTALRLEALADPSLVKGGPGRAANGNFDLTNIELQVASLATPGEARPIELIEPRATFGQQGLPIAAALDDQPRSGWAIDPEFGKSHAAAFRFATPVENPGGTQFTLKLSFNGNDGHNIGRLRLALTTATQDVDLIAKGVSALAAIALAKSPDERSAEERVAVLDWFKQKDPEWQKLFAAEQAHRAKEPKPVLTKVLVTGEGVTPIRLHTQGEDFFPQTYFLRRGEVQNKVAVADQGFLQVMMPTDASLSTWQASPPAGSPKSFRRTTLGNWLVDTEQGAGHLLARVIVNRLWQHHLGRGIVATPSDFGTRGEAPSHPELLDWLAGELIRNDWKLHSIHRLIVSSAVYAQSSAHDPAKAAIDSTNSLYWKWNARRLEAEVIRDSLLAVSGHLDPTSFGPGTLDETSRRRSIYFTIKRSQLVPMMQVFDAPDALTGVGERPTTTIAPQALLLLNNASSRKQAMAFAKRVQPSAEVRLDDAISRAYRLAIGRQPTPDELATAAAFFDAQRASYGQAGHEDAADLAMTDLCQAVLCLNEFVYIE